MSEYYAVERSGNSLVHYGVRGMKWGVKKARSTGNAAALGRQFRKAEKKLAKLEKRGASGKKYAKRAAKLGAAGAALGAAGAFGSLANIEKGRDSLLKLSSKVGVKSFHKGKSSVAEKAGHVASKAGNATSKAVHGYKKWGSEKLSNATGDVTKHGAIRVGSMAAGAGLLGAAGYNAYRAATAKKNRQKAAKFKAEMNKAFAGTKYANKAGTSSTNSVSGNKPRHGAKRSKR